MENKIKEILLNQIECEVIVLYGKTLYCKDE